jgi:pimeloyl-ACP methyl ester carboxylesterase
LDDTPKKSRALFAIVGCFVLPVVFVGLMSPPSYSGACYLLALVLMWLGPGLSRWRIVRALSVSARNRARWVGVVLFVVTLCVRMFTGSSEGLRYEQVGERSLLRAAFARLANERDLSGGASTLLRTFSMLPERGDRLATLFRDTYDQMDAADENHASPLLPTLLFGQSPESFDILRYHVDEPRGTLLFLHGYGGNVSAICWEMAQSAKAAGYETLCPSMRTQGDWGSPVGSEIVRAILADLEGSVVLAGLSNGANGAAILAPRFRRHIEGLVLISGAAQRAGRAGVPTLVIYGRHDEMFRPRVMRSYVERTDAQAVVLDAGHFIVLSERERVRTEVTRFLEARR